MDGVTHGYLVRMCVHMHEDTVYIIFCVQTTTHLHSFIYHFTISRTRSVPMMPPDFTGQFLEAVD